MSDPIYIACNQHDYRVNVWGVFQPQEDLRYIGNVPVKRFKTREEAEALKASIDSEGRTYVMDAGGWFRRVERCAVCKEQFMVDRHMGFLTKCKWCTRKGL